MVEPIARELFVEFRVAGIKRKVGDEIQPQREAAEQRRDKMTVGNGQRADSRALGARCHSLQSIWASAFRQRNAAADMSGELNSQRCDVSFSKAVISITRR